MDENDFLDGEDSEEVKIDPKTLAPDLYAAAKKSDLAEVARLLEEHVPPSHIDKELGWTCIHWAALNGDYKLMQLLLSHGGSGAYHRQLLREKKIDVGSYLGNKENDIPIDTTADTTENNDTNEVVYDDDEDKQYEDDDKSIDYTKNTPLLWAAFKGNLDVLWLLLLDGYSPNDTDDLENNALHLASSSGHKKIVQILIDDGARATSVNIYRNTPVDVALTKDIRHIIQQAQKTTASMTDSEIYSKHMNNIQKYKSNVETFNSTIANYNKIDSPAAIRSLPSLKAASDLLSSSVNMAKDEGLDNELIIQAESLIKTFDLLQDFNDDLKALNDALPITTQAQFIESCHPLERTMTRCLKEGINEGHLIAGREVIAMCITSNRLCTQAQRLTGLECAQPENHHDMLKLKETITKAETQGVKMDLIVSASSLFQKLDAEEKMAIALNSVPEVVRLPKEEPPEGYYQECDTGHIVHTEGYPLPPPVVDGVGGEYEWSPSEVYQQVSNSITLLKGCTDGADDLGANQEVLDRALAVLKKCEKDIKALEVKNEEDKIAAIEQATKEAKKLKKGKKKK